MNAPVLRDIQWPDPPGPWPPAWGWWLLAAFLVLGTVLVARAAWRRWRAWRRRRLLASGFDRAVSAADGAAARLAAASEQLRRAARIVDPAATTLAGDAWLCWLDRGDPARPFSRGVGRRLVDGAFAPKAPPHADDADALALARRRLIELGGRVDA